MKLYNGKPLNASTIRKMGLKDLGGAIQSFGVKGIQDVKKELQNLLIQHLKLEDNTKNVKSTKEQLDEALLEVEQLKRRIDELMNNKIH